MTTEYSTTSSPVAEAVANIQFHARQIRAELAQLPEVEERIETLMFLGFGEPDDANAFEETLTDIIGDRV